MLVRLSTRRAALLAAALVLAGCGPSSGPQSGSQLNKGTDKSAAPAHASSVLPGDHASTARYRISINYPPLPVDQVVLATVLHRVGDAAKRDFMQALAEPDKRPASARHQGQLRIDFKTAAVTPDFISVREQGMSDTGGAHPAPIDAAYVYAINARKVITLDDLFTDPDAARERMSTLTRNALQLRFAKQAPGADEATPQARREWMDNMQQMLVDGTEPTMQNFAQFIIGSDVDDGPGIIVIFPPYQVAPYVYGTQTVEIPATIFAGLLKPEYRNAFNGG